MTATAFVDLIQLMEVSPPTFHEWDGAPKVGGLGIGYLHWLHSLVSSQSDLPCKVAIETGAGISTLFFLALGYSLHSFSLVDVIGRIKDHLSRSPDQLARWQPHGGFSEETLSGFAAEKHAELADVCFIDGSHSVGSVFLDFVFLNRLLKQNGILVIDDTQLPGPSLLFQMMLQLPNYFELIGSFEKGVAFRKLWNKPYFNGNMDSMKFQYPFGWDGGLV